MSAVTLNLEFAGLVLPVVLGADGKERVPFKPITEAMGLDFNAQRRRFISARSAVQTPTCVEVKERADNDASIADTFGTYLARRLGVELAKVMYAGQKREMLCIRLDRVSTWMFTIDPSRVRAAGNTSAADFIEARHAEWDDLLHVYESERGGMVEQRGRARHSTIRQFLAVVRLKNQTQNPSDRRTLAVMARDLASDAGVPYQIDALDLPAGAGGGK